MQVMKLAAVSFLLAASAVAAMPERGICAHRGDNAVCPENTVPAFLSAIQKGAAMVEFDVKRCKTGELILMHDWTIDRTTTGKGKCSELTFDYLRSVDAGVKKDPKFKGTKIPTLDEALACFPKNGIWLNVHCIDEVAAEVAVKLKEKGFLHNAFIAAEEKGVAAARAAVPEVKVCFFSAPPNSWTHQWTAAEKRAAMTYVMSAKANFAQPHCADFTVEDSAEFRARGGKMNYFFCNVPQHLPKLMENGIDFPLTDKLDDMLKVYMHYTNAVERTARLHDAKWGVFNHFLGHNVKTAEEWNKRVNGFNVDKLADQLKECGAKFYFITVMQGRKWMCAPNATFDRIADTKPGEACSQRDLPMELADALAKRGIDLYLYFTGDGPYLSIPEGTHFGFIEPRSKGVTKEFVGKWAAVLEEYAVRYGDKVKGWWIDGCYADFLKYNNDLLRMYELAVKKGNPHAVIAMNNGVKPEYLKYYRNDDFTAGEFNDFTTLPVGRFTPDWAQTFLLAPLGTSKTSSPFGAWSQTGCKRDAKYMADFVEMFNKNGGVVAVEVHVNDDGSFDADQFEVLKAIGERNSK